MTKVLVRLSGLLFVMLVSACAAHSPPLSVPPVTSAPVDSHAPTIAGGGKARASTSQGYAGHGVETIRPDLLQKYRPAPLAPEVSRRIESLIDVRAPGVGRLSPDGKSMYFSWTISGIGQVWKIDGPKRFPQKLTGGAESPRLASFPPHAGKLSGRGIGKGATTPG